VATRFEHGYALSIDLSQEVPDERRLADTRLSADTNHRGAARKDLLEMSAELLQLAIAADERRLRL
jgi:hypothetical protein